jgi:hypothetical protein
VLIPEYTSRPLGSDKEPAIPKLALVFGFAPLAFGILIFLLWITTRNQILPGMGAVNIVLGLLCFLLGCCVLLAHVVNTWELLLRGADRGRRWMWVAITFAILLSNFPVCLLIILLINHFF